jgi:hypothetical protein
MASPPAICASCGARVEAMQRDEAYVYTCRFCQTRISIDPLVAKQPPRPVPQLAPTPREAGLAAGGGRRMVSFIVFLSLVPAVIGVVVALRPLLSGVVSSHLEENFPITVGLNENVEIHDRTATGTSTMVTVGVNGKVTIRRCHLKGPLIVQGGTNAEITIIDSTLVATREVVTGDVNVKVKILNSTLTSDDAVIDLPVNPGIDISDGSKLTAQGVAITSQVNAEVSLDGSSVDGKVGGITCSNSCKVKMAGGAIVKSDGTAIELEQNGHVAIVESRIDGKVKGLEIGNNGAGTIRGSGLAGPKGALVAGRNTSLVLVGAKFDGPKTAGAGSKIDER